MEAKFLPKYPTDSKRSSFCIDLGQGRTPVEVRRESSVVTQIPTGARFRVAPDSGSYRNSTWPSSALKVAMKSFIKVWHFGVEIQASVEPSGFG